MSHLRITVPLILCNQGAPGTENEHGGIGGKFEKNTQELIEECSVCGGGLVIEIEFEDDEVDVLGDVVRLCARVDVSQRGG